MAARVQHQPGSALTHRPVRALQVRGSPFEMNVLPDLASWVSAELEKRAKKQASAMRKPIALHTASARRMQARPAKWAVFAAAYVEAICTELLQCTVQHALQYNAPLWSDSSRLQVQAIRAELRVTKSLYTSLHREARLSSHTVHAVAQHAAECACMHTRHTAPHARRNRAATQPLCGGRVSDVTAQPPHQCTSAPGLPRS